MAHGIAILGAGIFVNEAYIPTLKVLAEASPALKAVYSRSRESAQTLSDFAAKSLGLTNPPVVYFDGDPNANLDTLLAREDIQSVIIALPITVQPEVVITCLKAGKHVLSEKPIAPTVKEGIDLIQQYESVYKPKGLIWRVAENFEAEPVFQVAGSLIKGGRIGKVAFFKSTVINYIDKDSKWYKTPWRTVPKYQGGFLLDGGVHTIAALRVLLPEPLTEITGFASLNKDYLAPHDTINVVARAGQAFHGSLDITFASPTKATPAAEEIVVTGSKGWLAINRKGKAYTIKIVTIAKDGQVSGEDTTEILEIEGKGVEVECKAFFEKVSGKEEAANLGDPNGALRDVAFIEGALNSNGSLLSLVPTSH